MTDYGSTDVEGSDLTERGRRALEQYLTVLRSAAGMYNVVSESGKRYAVDAREDHCTCPDHQYQASGASTSGASRSRRARGPARPRRRRA